MNTDHKIMEQMMMLRAITEEMLRCYENQFHDETLLHLGALVSKSIMLYDSCSEEFAKSARENES